MDDERFQRGLATLGRLDSQGQEFLQGSLEDIAPDLARHTIEFAFGDILSRPGLDIRSREIATLAALTALGHAIPQLEWHVGAALNAGLSRQEVVEIIMQMAVYAGFPACLNAMQAAKRVFAQRDQEGRQP
ncbi:MAG: carboxymuconolactone decarboxylase family protein [Desulfarculus sp.]|nr:carboxymuconolactone decarboxylase family protein [Desulfarculus sp.]